MFKSTTLASAALLAAVSCTAWMTAPSHAAVLFSSDFSGTDNDPLVNSPDWMAAWNQSNANNDVQMRTMSNEGYLTKSGTSVGAYYAVKAEDNGTGSSAKFSPSDQLRFQIDVKRMVDPRSRTSENIYFIQYFSPSNYLETGNGNPEYLNLFVSYNKTSNISGSNLGIWFQQHNTGLTTLWNPTGINVNGLQLDDATSPGNVDVQLSMQLDGATGKAQAGYQVVMDGAGQGWNYSGWFDLSTGAQAFDSNWAANWAGNTQWYLVTGGAGQTPAAETKTWIDNASVTGVPEPAALSLLGLGALALWPRRRG